MKLLSLKASHYRSLKHVEITLGSLNVVIGANASGKSNILDALRFLSEGVRAKDFADSVADRGGIVHLAWKGAAADELVLETLYEEENGNRYTWSVGIQRQEYRFEVWEQLSQLEGAKPPTLLLEAKGGKVWWWSTQAKNNKVRLALAPTACALAAACADESFPARQVGQFVERWGFFDPSPPLLRRASNVSDAERLNPSGSNLAARLHALRETPEGNNVFARVVKATSRILGVPEDIETRLEEADGRVYFVQREPGLTYRVHQIGASSGTLRILALMTALFAEPDTSLVGIEEPENHVHPSALKAFAEYLRDASERVQLLVTTHSPILLDCLPRPEEVVVVRRTEEGTALVREENPEAVNAALEAYGHGPKLIPGPAVGSSA